MSPGRSRSRPHREPLGWAKCRTGRLLFGKRDHALRVFWVDDREGHLWNQGRGGGIGTKAKQFRCSVEMACDLHIPNSLVTNSLCTELCQSGSASSRHTILFGSSEKKVCYTPEATPIRILFGSNHIASFQLNSLSKPLEEPSSFQLYSTVSLFITWYPTLLAWPDTDPKVECLRYSTVTLLARLRGLSTSQPRAMAMW